jgi:hypothetical protein
MTTKDFSRILLKKGGLENEEGEARLDFSGFGDFSFFSAIGRPGSGTKVRVYPGPW